MSTPELLAELEPVLVDAGQAATLLSLSAEDVHDLVAGRRLRELFVEGQLMIRALDVVDVALGIA